jgi:hypothetical protein
MDASQDRQRQGRCWQDIGPSVESGWQDRQGCLPHDVCMQRQDCQCFSNSSTNELADTATDKSSAGGKENKRPSTHKNPTILQLVCQARKSKTATFPWPVSSQEYYTANKLPPPRFCTACADKRSKRNQRQLANTSINKK